MDRIGSRDEQPQKDSALLNLSTRMCFTGWNHDQMFLKSFYYACWRKEGGCAKGILNILLWSMGTPVVMGQMRTRLTPPFC